MQIVGANGVLIATIGHSKSSLWPDKEEAEANIEAIVKAVNDAEALQARIEVLEGELELAKADAERHAYGADY